MPVNPKWYSQCNLDVVGQTVTWSRSWKVHKPFTTQHQQNSVCLLSNGNSKLSGESVVFLTDNRGNAGFLSGAILSCPLSVPCSWLGQGLGNWNSSTAETANPHMYRWHESQPATILLASPGIYPLHQSETTAFSIFSDFKSLTAFSRAGQNRDVLNSSFARAAFRAKSFGVELKSLSLSQAPLSHPSTPKLAGSSIARPPNFHPAPDLTQHHIATINPL